MQHDHFLKKMNFDLLTLSQGSGGGEYANKILLSCCCIRDSLLFDMQYKKCSEKLNFDLLTPTAGSGRVCGQNECYHAASFGNSL